jgi:hypothetical protein
LSNEHTTQIEKDLPRTFPGTKKKWKEEEGGQETEEEEGGRRR